MEPDRFARKVLAALSKNRAVVIVPAWWRIIWWLNRLSPSLGMAISRRQFEAAKKAMLQGT